MYSTGGGNKFDGFLEFWRNDPRSRGYRYYLLLDDDVYFARRYFAIPHHTTGTKIELAQPLK